MGTALTGYIRDNALSLVYRAPEALVVTLIAWAAWPKPFTFAVALQIILALGACACVRWIVRSAKVKDVVYGHVTSHIEATLLRGWHKLLARLPKCEGKSDLRLLGYLTFVDHLTGDMIRTRVAINPTGHIIHDGKRFLVELRIFADEKADARYISSYVTAQITEHRIILMASDIGPRWIRGCTTPVVFCLRNPVSDYTLTSVPVRQEPLLPHPAGLTGELVASVRKISDSDKRCEAMDLATRRVASLPQLNALRSDFAQLLCTPNAHDADKSTLALINARLDDAERTYAS